MSRELISLSQFIYIAGHLHKQKNKHFTKRFWKKKTPVKFSLEVQTAFQIVKVGKSEWGKERRIETREERKRKTTRRENRRNYD